ncbi:hypothetical protein ACFY20_37745 [Streptomyces sp. NPDC001312]|uniref:hypothetical protein n=1 Tax=Streptomyces sp. NPDC001312 TaxID=3364561 RepID=UPI003691AEC0
MALLEGDEMLTGILSEEHLCGFDQLPALVAKHAARAGMGSARVFVPDLRRQLLREVTGQGLDAGAGGETYEVDTALPGRAFASSRPLPGGDGEQPRRWWMPILGGTERLGVLRVDLAQGVEPERAGALASLVGLLLMLIARLRRLVITRGRLPVRILVASSAKVVSRTWWSWFSIFQWPRIQSPIWAPVFGFGHADSTPT